MSIENYAKEPLPSSLFMKDVPIVILVDTIVGSFAGSEKQVLILCSALSDAGYNVELVALRSSPFLEKFVSSFPVRCLGVTSLKSIKAFEAMLRLRVELKSLGLCVVHAYFPDSCVLAPLFLRSRQTRVITSRRDMGLIYLDMPLALFRWLRFKTDYVVSNSRAVRDFCAEKELLSEAQLRVIRNAIEMPTLSDHEPAGCFTSEGALRIVHVANIKPVKRQLDLLKAMALLRDKGVLIECVFVGCKQDEAYFGELEKFVTDSGLFEQISFYGHADSPYSVLLAADVGVLCSQSEGLSNALMEYMAAGLFCVASDVGGNTELIQPNHTGKLYEMGNSYALADCLKEARAPQAKMYGVKARLFMEQNFSVQKLVEEHLNLYSEACH